ncbi:uncharacterized protein LOC131287124 [Anopheles ziemanni]|uniref:uncharacterized protein LOC131287124 n=1 Tax=Anopheles ziemanni TaxID=345580 RepID=UPI0026591A4A|nr:uncharacterized protein LOC131271555 isoform X1 [Anopheles coustani]XP_058172126.1 uncharacterized protein LOC131287124 [Anopheles ziemanni]
MVARAGRSRFFVCLGLLILTVGFLTIFHNSQQQLDELRQLGLRCEQQQKSVQAQMEVIVDQKLRLENSLESERMINEANRKELKQRAQDEKEEHSKSSMEANIRYASLQQQCNLVKSQLGDLTEECSKSKKLQSEEVNALRLKVSELQGKVQRYKQESDNDAEHLKAQVEQLKNEKINLEATLRQQLVYKDQIIEKLRDLATKMEKENAHYLEQCKLPAEQLPRQHHRYRDVLEALSAANSLKANAHSFNEQLSVSEDLYRIPVALRSRPAAAPVSFSTTASSTTGSVSVGSLATSSPSFATNIQHLPAPAGSFEEQETRVIANPFELVPDRAAEPDRTRRSKTNPPDGGGGSLQAVLDGGIINSVENFQIIPKPLPAVVAPAEGSPNNNVLQEPHLMKTSTSVSASGRRFGGSASSDRNMQLPILAAPTVLPVNRGVSVPERASKSSKNGARSGGGGTIAGGASSSTTSTTSTASSVSRAGAAPNRSTGGSVARKPLANRHSKPVPVGIVPFPDVMPELEENISENIMDNRYANVAAAAAAASGTSTGSVRAGAPSAGIGGGKKGKSDKRHGGVGADLNFLNGGANLDADNGAHEVHDNEVGGKRNAGNAGLDDREGPAAAGDGVAADDEQLAMGGDNLNAAEEDTNLYDNANGKAQFGGNPLLDQQLEYNEVMVPGGGQHAALQHARRNDHVRRMGGGSKRDPGAAGGPDSKAAIIDRMGDKLINEIAHDHGKEGDNYPNEMEDLHLVGNEAEEEDVSDYDDPTALKQGHAERN